MGSIDFDKAKCNIKNVIYDGEIEDIKCPCFFSKSMTRDPKRFAVKLDEKYVGKK